MKTTETTQFLILSSREQRGEALCYFSIGSKKIIGYIKQKNNNFVVGLGAPSKVKPTDKLFNTIEDAEHFLAALYIKNNS